MEIPAEEHAEENEMKKSLILSGVAALIIAATLGVAQAQKESSTKKKNVIYVAAEQATFKQSPAAGGSLGGLWGDSGQGGHRKITKVAPGDDAGTHQIGTAH